MTSSISDLVHDLTEVIHKIICKDCGRFFISENIKEKLIKYKCLSCNKDYSDKFFDNDITKFILLLKKRFKNTFKFCNNDINKFILLLRKGVYPYGYMDDWGKFNVTTLPEKEEFF